MTVFAGAFAYSKSACLPQESIKYFQEFFETIKTDKNSISKYEDDSIVVLKWDSGAYKEPAWSISKNRVLKTLAGDPIFSHSNKRLPRHLQLDLLCDEEGAFDKSKMVVTRGVFSIISYNPALCLLRISSDLLGIRPIYYIDLDGVFYFASAMHLIESIPHLRRTIDQQGVAEWLAFGYSLGNRTPYQEIKLLSQSSGLSVDHAGVRIEEYFSWDDMSICDDSPQAVISDLFTVFEDGINIRLDERKNATAYLSGGMDSRAIVASLVDKDCHVRALNFSPQGSQDQAFAIKFSKVLGNKCNLTLHSRGENPNWSFLAAEQITRTDSLADNAEICDFDSSQEPQSLIWSGDGGSVCLGHVYLNDEIVEVASSGDFSRAADLFLRKNKLDVPKRIFSDNVRLKMQQLLKEGVVSEMMNYGGHDSGRSPYYFLLFNDQRRHLHKHFETIHLHQLEFILPFFDSAFIKEIVKTPPSWGIAHRMYSEWYNCFDPIIRSTPWQTYPGHASCPVVEADTYDYQWDVGVKPLERLTFLARWEACTEIFNIIFLRKLPGQVSISSLLIISTAHIIGVRDFSYLFRAVRDLGRLNFKQ